MSSSLYFAFEQDFVASLRCIPMAVRLKLDTCGVKLKLAHWHLFTQAERQQLVDRPCETAADIAAYRHHLQALVVAHAGQPAKELTVDPQPPWQWVKVPPQVQAQAQAHSLSLTDTQWQSLETPQKFALLKLSRPSHENRNFVPAMQEFGLA
ncbi:MAG: nitrate reductase associated protein [Cyanobacteria bacterium P01_A01_bin.105]